VLKSDELWIVEFYAPWCGHCKNLAPEFEKASKALKGIVKLGAVDMTVDGSVGSKYNIQGYPTLKFFGDDKKSPKDYDSGRTAKDLVSFALKQAETIANKRLGVKAESKPNQEQKREQEANTDDSDVVVLTESNFESQVLASDDLWLVEFYAPWCGHCKKLAPEWAQAATELKGSVKLGKVDATVENSLASKYGVQGYPTIKFFIPGNSQPEEYNGGRDAGSIVRTALNKLDTSGKPPKLNQLLGAGDLKNNCEKNVCVIAFLPHIYDSSANERNKYIESFTEVAKKNRGKPIKFLWAQAGDFYKFEQLIGFGSGYPAVAGISLAKSRTAIMQSAYNVADVDSFVRKLLGGNVPLKEYKELPKIDNVTPWDGEDHQPEIVNDDL
jgi:protein disulfide-isomerase A6